MLKAQVVAAQEAYDRHLKSSKKEGNAWLTEAPANFMKARKKAMKEMRDACRRKCASACHSAWRTTTMRRIEYGHHDNECSRNQRDGSNVVVVDLGEPQSSAEVEQLTKGKGKLLKHVDQIVKDLVSQGTVKSGAQPMVIVVREYPVPPWASGDDDDD